MGILKKSMEFRRIKGNSMEKSKEFTRRHSRELKGIQKNSGKFKGKREIQGNSCEIERL